MILAAGLGTRLKPLTDSIPKALVEVDGVPMLERVIIKLKEEGFSKIFINVHHFARQVTDFLTSRNFGIELTVSDESEALLDTGGGIAKAAPLLFKDDRRPVLFHNVDILSNASLKDVIASSMEEQTGGTLLVSERDSSRRLIFDKEKRLRGWHDIKNGKYRPEGFVPSSEDSEYAFSGIYSLGQEAVEEMKRLNGEGKYSVMDYFLHPGRKELLKGMVDKNLRLLDIGKPATLAQAPVLLKSLLINSN